MAYSECLPTRLTPLAERTRLFLPGARAGVEDGYTDAVVDAVYTSCMEDLAEVGGAPAPDDTVVGPPRDTLQHETQNGAVWRIRKPPPDSDHAAVLAHSRGAGTAAVLAQVLANGAGLAADAAAGSAGEAAGGAPRAATPPARPEEASSERTGETNRASAASAAFASEFAAFAARAAASAAGRAPESPRPPVSYTVWARRGG
jgi:hypothetical protein